MHIYMCIAHEADGVSSPSRTWRCLRVTKRFGDDDAFRKVPLDLDIWPGRHLTFITLARFLKKLYLGSEASRSAPPRGVVCVCVVDPRRLGPCQLSHERNRASRSRPPHRAAAAIPGRAFVLGWPSCWLYRQVGTKSQQHAGTSAERVATGVRRALLAACRSKATDAAAPPRTCPRSGWWPRTMRRSICTQTTLSSTQGV